ncbi:hypothetical protein [Mycoplasma sp. P36-A1]|uniref:hypothetical protein n=1 Tax=Mycoplasma sp. P36-A1 TaxID=3252900 RepID=UPI003C2B88A5
MKTLNQYTNNIKKLYNPKSKYFLLNLVITFFLIILAIKSFILGLLFDKVLDSILLVTMFYYAVSKFKKNKINS